MIWFLDVPCFPVSQSAMLCAPCARLPTIFFHVFCVRDLISLHVRFHSFLVGQWSVRGLQIKPHKKWANNNQLWLFGKQGENEKVKTTRNVSQGRECGANSGHSIQSWIQTQTDAESNEGKLRL